MTLLIEYLEELILVKEKFKMIKKDGTIFNVGEYATVQILNEDGSVRKELNCPGHFSLSGGHGDKKYFSTHGHYVHRLVAEAFHGLIPAGYTVNHMDGNILNNAASNLEIITHAENMRHAYEFGLMYNGPLSPLAEFEERIESENTRKYYKRWGIYDLKRSLIADFRKVQEAADYLGVSRQAIHTAGSLGKAINKQFYCCRIKEMNSSLGE